MRVALALALALGLGTGTACSAASGDDGESAGATGALRPLERTLVGEARPYPADPRLAAREAELRGSMAARRRVAWEAVARVLAPVAIDGEGKSGQKDARTVPLFRTWYGRDDVARLFGRLRTTMGADAIAARRAPTPGELSDAAAWNASFTGAWSDADLAERVSRLTTREDIDGLGGNARVTYSPGLARHLLARWADVDACQKRPVPAADVERDGSDFVACFGAEPPADAAVVKASWWRAGEGLGLPVHDTDAATLAARRASARDEGGWGRAGREANPGPAEIYTVRTSEGATFRMPAMHVVTKELRDWLWITLWWSDAPDEDFGADRPEAIRRLAGPWSHYKMSVVTSFDEGDADPRGGAAGSLGDALAAVHEGAGGPTWTSNPYLERGARNAQTNCIGCHQHAGVRGMTSEKVLGDARAFPASGRTRTRKNFPADYLFALESDPERLARIVQTP